MTLKLTSTMQSLGRLGRHFLIPILMVTLIRILQNYKRILSNLSSWRFDAPKLVSNLKTRRLLEILHEKRDLSSFSPTNQENDMQISVASPELCKLICEKSVPDSPLRSVDDIMNLESCKSLLHDITVQITLDERKKWTSGPIDLLGMIDDVVYQVVSLGFFHRFNSENDSILRTATKRIDSSKLFKTLSFDYDEDPCEALTPMCERLIVDFSEQGFDGDGNVNKLHPKSITEIAFPNHRLSPAALADLIVSSVALSRSICYWALYHLAVYEECQLLVNKETDNLIGRRVPPQFDEVQSLQYLDLFLKESMRMVSPLAIDQRVVQETIEVEGYGPIESRTKVNLILFLANKSSSSFTNSETFDPSRFLRETEKASWMRTNHVGADFGISIAKALITSVVQQYRIKLTPDSAAKSCPFDCDSGFSYPASPISCFLTTRDSGRTL